MLRVEELELPNKKKISFRISENEGVLLEGANGIGKSLFLKTLALLYPPKFKSFSYKGEEVLNINPQFYRSQVMYVSPHPLLHKNQKVSEFFEIVFRLKIYENFHSQFDYQKFLNKWGIQNTALSLLSSGQLQLISLLRALTLRPKILLLDEPTANLDPDKTLEIEKLLMNWLNFPGRSMIMISHSQEQSLRMGLGQVSFESLIC